MYTDGSVNRETKSGGAGIVIHWTNNNKTEISSAIGSLCSCARAEVTALKMATQILMEDQKSYNTKIVFLTDSKETLKMIETPKNSEICELLQELHRLSNKAKNIVIQWIPGHVGIEENERADQLANEGTKKDQENQPLTLSEYKAIIKTEIAENWNTAHPNYNRNDSIHSLPRPGQTMIFRLRTGHNRLNEHLYTKLGVASSPMCPCGAGHQNTAHILQTCQLHSTHRHRIWPSGTDLHTKLYGDCADLRKTMDFVSSIGVQL